jgi:sulfotransferase
MIDAMYEHRPESIIIDKNRGWGKNMPASTILFKREIRVIATVRDLPSIMASWLTIIKRNPGNYIDQKLINSGHQADDSNRMAEMWFNMVKDCMESLVQLKKDAGNRLLLVDYDRLVRDPMAVLGMISAFLDLPPHDYDMTNIESDTNDNDLIAWGLAGMHAIVPRLEKTADDPRTVLGETLYQRFVDLEKQY